MSSTESPLFSVVMATYGRGRHILPSVRSVLAQDLDDFELLVVGDRCEDDTAAVLAPMLCDRFRWTNLSARCGSQSGPNNEGIRLARGQLIAYIGHDDIWEPSHLSSLARLFARAPTLDFGVSGAIYHLPHGIPGSLVTGMFVGDSAKYSHFFPPSSLAHRAGVIDIIGPWSSPEATVAAVDCDLLGRAAAADLSFASTRRVTVHKFAAGHRYLSYVRPESHEQQAMLAQLGTRRHDSHVDLLIAEAMVGGTYMSLPAAYDARDRGEPGDAWRANLTRKGLNSMVVRPLTERIVIHQSPSQCAFDWEGTVRDGLRWSYRSPRPRVLVPVTAKVPVRLDLEVAHADAAALAPFQVRINDEFVNILGCELRQSASRPARALLSMRMILREEGPSVLELLLPEQLRPTPQRRGMAIGDMILEQ